MDAEIETQATEYSRFNSLRTLSANSPSEFEVHRVGNATLLVDRARPCPGICNRVFGFDASYVTALGEIQSHYSSGRPRFDLRPEAVTGASVDALMSVGYRPMESLVYLSATPTDHEESEVHVERWTESRADDFIRLLERSGAPYSETNWSLRREYYCTDLFRTFVAFQDDEPVGWATMFVSGEHAVLANAFVFEHARRRGCHSALLRSRLTDAFHLGLERVVTDVEPQSESLSNCRRAGFQIETIHTIWVCADSP